MGLVRAQRVGEGIRVRHVERTFFMAFISDISSKFNGQEVKFDVYLLPKYEKIRSVRIRTDRRYTLLFGDLRVRIGCLRREWYDPTKARVDYEAPTWYKLDRIEPRPLKYRPR